MGEEFVALGHAGSEHYAGLETFPNPGVALVELTSDELVAMCPVTSQPDMYVATIEYEPDKLCLESKSLKLYLASLPQRGRVLRGARRADPRRRRRGARAAARAGQRRARAEGARRDHDRRLDLTAFDPTDPAFLADPYPRLAALREETPLFYEETLDRWFVTRHAEVRACLRDRRLGRNFRHVGSEAEFAAAEPLDPRRQAFWDSERWSLLWLEPPEHTRIRKLVAAAFTPRSVDALRGPCAELANELLPDGDFDLLRDFAQPYSIAVICRLLGVPTDRSRDLLDWSHAMVKMYELDTTETQAEAATLAAAEFRDYVVSLAEERRREPRDDLVTRLVETSIDGNRLTDPELVSTIIVLLNAGHEATVNTLGNGVLALLQPPHAVAAARARRGRAGRGGRGADPLGPSAPALRALGARGRRRDRRRAGAARGEGRAALRRREPRPAGVRRPGRASTSAARTLPSTSASAAVSTSASARRWRGSSWRRR